MVDPNPTEPANVEVEVLETVKLLRVVEPKKELMLVARIFPPVMVSPFVEEIPVVVTPCRVEEAVEVAKKLLAEREPAKVPAP